ncbi:MAG: hypothetical protein ABI832_20005 [bacterium]
MSFATTPIMRRNGGMGSAGLPPAVFPMGLVKAALTAFSDPGDPGDPIYEPFCCSSTQNVAAERTGRRRFAMELNQVYCDDAARRWKMATGRTAEYRRNLT